MYLSRLLPCLRSQVVRDTLAHFYKLHGTLMLAFPRENEGGAGRVMFRVDVERMTGAVSILVQSDKPPSWSALPERFLGEPAACKSFVPGFIVGQRLIFRLRANPTVKRDGKRLPLRTEDEQVAWLARKGGEAGFRVLHSDVAVEDAETGHKRGAGTTMTITLHAVRFDGVLTVTDPEKLSQAVRDGIGSAKGFGFGLLSLAPERN